MKTKKIISNNITQNICIDGLLHIIIMIITIIIIIIII
jgi:hypothetical protein